MSKPPMDFLPASYRQFLAEQSWRDTVPTDDGAFARLIRHIEQYPRCVSDACGQNADRCPTPDKCGLLAPAPAEAVTEIDSTTRPSFLDRNFNAVFWPVAVVLCVIVWALAIHLALRILG